MSHALRFLVVLVAVALAGCAKAPSPQLSAVDATSYQAGSGQATAGTSVAPAAVTAINGKAVPAITLASAAAPLSVGNDYTIAPLDVLDITVFQVPDLSGSFAVDANGQIDMPLIGAVVANGKTLDQLKAELTKELGDKYLQSPDVRVTMKEAVSQRITVAGAVNKPGVYPTTGPTTLIQVMALAGGFDPIADPRGIVVFRNVNGKRTAAKFDYKAIRAGTADDPIIAGGDVVMVDESGMKASFRGLRESMGLFGMFAPLAMML